MSNKVGLTLKAKFDNGRSVSGGGAVFHTERSRKEDRLNLKTEPNTITLYRHGLEQVDKSNSREVFGYFKDLEESIKADYQQHSHRNRKWQDKNELFYEGIIAFGREQFEQVNNPQKVMDYCVNFCDMLEEKTDAKIHMVSLHLDEGHLDDNGVLQHNYHAHFLLVNYNEKTHKSALRNARMLVDEYKTEVKSYTNKDGEIKQKTVKTKEPTGNKIEALYDFKQIQNDLGKHFAGLGFERGRDYASEGLKCPKNIDYKQYSEIKAQEQQQRKEIIQDINEQLEPIRKLGEELDLEYSDGKSFVESLTNKVFEPLAALDKHLKPEIRETLETVQQLTDEINKAFTAKDQIIADFKTRINQQNLELAQLKEAYNQTREQLKATKEAKQVDYQELKKEYETIKKTLEADLKKEITNAKQQGFKLYEEKLERDNSSIAKRTLLKAIEKPIMPLVVNNQLSNTTLENISQLLEIKQRIEEKPIIQEVIVKKEKIIEVPKTVEKLVEKVIEKPIIVNVDENKRLQSELATKNFKLIEHESKIRALQAKISLLETEKRELSRENDQLKTDNQYQKADIKQLRDENFTLKIENKALKTAIERFLEIGIVKGIAEGAKTLIERFNAAVEAVKTTFSKNQELAKENETLKEQVQKQEKQQTRTISQGYSRGGGGMSL